MANGIKAAMGGNAVWFEDTAVLPVGSFMEHETEQLREVLLLHYESSALIYTDVAHCSRRWNPSALINVKRNS